MELGRSLSRADLARLAVAVRTRGPAWLDGDGSPELGARSILAFDPLETRLAPFGSPGPLDVIGASELTASGTPWIGALSYDVAWADPRRFGLRAERRLERREDAMVLALQRHRVALTVEHATGRATLAAIGDPAAAAREVDELVRAGASASVGAKVGGVESESRAVHRAAIVAALDAIGRGDLYQVNLARRWSGQIEGEPLALYLAMREASPVPLGAYLELPDGSALLSCSMERFLSFDARSRTIETRPIKGTIRHGASGAPAADLRAIEKERAEHAMIVDLMRNDLGRVAETGSVRPREVFRVEPYAGLSHLVSIVEGRARDGIGAAEILAATFPPGSVTGAPKLAAMELVERLERFPRGFYTGAIGAIEPDGSLALSVAIRTAHVRGGEVEYFAGGGIVEASDPDAEVDETELKAKVLTDAIAKLG